MRKNHFEGGILKADIRRYNYESKNHHGLRRMQAAQLQYHEKQKERSLKARDEQVLPVLQKAHASQRNKIVERGEYGNGRKHTAKNREKRAL